MRLLDKAGLYGIVNDMAQQPRKETPLRFRFIGWQGDWSDGWYALRMPTRHVPAIQVHAFMEQITDWLFEQDILLNEQAYIANGNTGDGPVVPAAEDGSVMALLFRNADDLMRFHVEFDCDGVTPQRLYRSLYAKASIPNFVLASLARTAYASIRQMITETGEDFPEWDQRDDDEQQFFLQLIREYLEDPTRTPEAMHEAWLDRRRMEDWHYAPIADLANRRHPSMVPFGKLAAREQHETRLTAAIVTSLAPMLRRNARRT